MLAEAGCVFMGFILFISGVQGRANGICALKGSSVELPCSAKHPTSSMKWYKVHQNKSSFVWKELSADENYVTYYTPKERNLTIKNLKESDEHKYCCTENTDQKILCMIRTIQLYVADLQVKVIPTTDGQTVTLMCNTSCPLTEKPAAYIWYKNGEFLYQDWSPWYQELVSSDEAVTYSCAVKGYEDLRAPEVSVDSVTSTCFNVTYAKGKMCSYNKTSVDLVEPCSITYPREVHVRKTPAGKLTCRTSCPLTDSRATFRSYRGGYFDKYIKSQHVFESWKKKSDRVSCAVKDNKDLLSAEVCRDDKNCWSVNYVSRRICALEGSSVNISSEYLHPENKKPKAKDWYRIETSSEEEAEELIEAADRVEYQDNMKNLHILRIKNLKKNDSAEYRFKLQTDKGLRKSNLPGVTLFVTGLTVKFTPSAEVTEGQRVTLTCSTSCPFPDDTDYIWYMNSRPLTLPGNQHKHLVLDPVSSQQAGNYSCAVETHNISSHEKTLTVKSKTGIWTPAAATGVCAALLVIIPLTVFLCIRCKRTSSQSPTTETNNMEEFSCGPVYDNISAPPTRQDFHRGRVHFSKNQTNPLSSTVQTPQPAEQEHAHYAVVNFKQKRTPE